MNYGPSTATGRKAHCGTATVRGHPVQARYGWPIPIPSMFPGRFLMPVFCALLLTALDWLSKKFAGLCDRMPKNIFDYRNPVLSQPCLPQAEILRSLRMPAEIWIDTFCFFPRRELDPLNTCCRPFRGPLEDKAIPLRPIAEAQVTTVIAPTTVRSGIAS